MSKFLRNLSDGTLRCKYCGDNECLCMEDGWTTIGIVGIWNNLTEGGSVLIQPKKQKLPNGKIIPSGYQVWVKPKQYRHLDTLLKKITVTNDFLNRLRFD